MQAARGASLTSSDAPSTPARLPSRRVALLFGCAALVYVIDICTKVLAVARLEDRGYVEVVGSLLRLTLVRNPGAAFSTGTEFTIALTFLAMAAVATVLYLSPRVRSTWWAVALGLLLGGVSGNLTDRLLREPGFLRGHVIDFLQLPHWPVFNVADMSINVAAALIIVQALRGVSLDGRRHEQ